jgi:DNA-binding MarR family transcriptional regulator
MISNASKTINRLKGKYMSRYGLSGTHTICLRQLFENEAGLTKSEIADCCDIDKAQITRVVNELITKGYAVSDESKRAYNRKFFLTEKGRAIAEEINGIVLRVVEFVSGDIPTAEIESFYAIFERINNKLKDSEEYFKKGF